MAVASIFGWWFINQPGQAFSNLLSAQIYTGANGGMTNENRRHFWLQKGRESKEKLKTVEKQGKKSTPSIRSGETAPGEMRRLLTPAQTHLTHVRENNVRWMCGFRPGSVLHVRIVAIITDDWWRKRQNNNSCSVAAPLPHGMYKQLEWLTECLCAAYWHRCCRRFIACQSGNNSRGFWMEIEIMAGRVREFYWKCEKMGWKTLNQKWRWHHRGASLCRNLYLHWLSDPVPQSSVWCIFPTQCSPAFHQCYLFAIWRAFPWKLNLLKQWHQNYPIKTPVKTITNHELKIIFSEVIWKKIQLLHLHLCS